MVEWVEITGEVYEALTKHLGDQLYAVGGIAKGGFANSTVAEGAGEWGLTRNPSDHPLLRHEWKGNQDRYLLAKPEPK